MGYIRHHALVVTGWGYPDVSEIYMERLRQRAIGIIQDTFGESEYKDPAHLVTEVISSIMNDYASFAILADGSKEHWQCSDLMDAARDRIKRLLTTNLDKGVYVDWIEVEFGGDSPLVHIEHGDEERED